MKSWLIVSLIALMTCSQAFAQAERVAGFDRPFTFRSKTNVVLIPAVVQDSAGKHVSGLGKSDFTILENGKPQQVAIFEETKTDGRVPLRPRKEGERSNILASDDEAKRLTIIVLDMVNTPFLDQSSAKEQILKYLSNSIDSREPTALVALRNGGLQVLSDFTTDPRILIAALRGASGEIPSLRRSTREIDSGSTNDLNTLIASMNIDNTDPANPAIQIAVETIQRLQGFESTQEREYAGYKKRDAMALTLSAFEQIAEAYSGIPGRKSLLWATAGFPFNVTSSGEVQSPAVFAQGGTYGGGRGDTSGNLGTLPESTALISSDAMNQLTPLYIRAIQALSNASIAVYPIDARGLLTFEAGADVHRLDPVVQREIKQEHADSHATMKVIADMTGGRPYYNTNDISRSFHDAASDDLVYYTLGYYRQAETKKQKRGWQKIEIKANKPGLRVRARQGFMVSSEKSDAKPVKANDFAVALESPLQFSEIPVTVRLSKASALDPKVNKKAIAFEIDLPRGYSLIDGNHYDLDVMAIATDAKGERVNQVGQNLTGSLPPEALKTIQSDGMNYRNALQLSNGQYSLHFIVRDNLNAQIGSVIMPIKIE